MSKLPPPKSPSEAHTKAPRTSNRFQMWIIGLLASEDLKMPKSEGRSVTSAWIISKSMPWDMTGDVFSQEDIIHTLEDMMVKNWQFKLSSNRDRDKDDYCLTSSGMLQFRIHLRPLLKILDDKNQYDTLITKTDGPHDVKIKLREIQPELKNRWHEEALNFLIKTASDFGSKAIIFLINMAMPHSGAPMS